MKKLMMILGFGLLAATATSQTDKQALATVADSYVESLAQKDWRASFNFIYPGVFELIDREELAGMIDELINDDKIDFSINSVLIGDVGDIKPFDGGKFSHINYSVDFVLTMKPGFSHSRAEELLGFLSSEAGSIVTKSNDGKTISVKGPKSLLAINDSYSNGWKLLERLEDDEMLLSMVLPQALYKELF